MGKVRTNPVPVHLSHVLWGVAPLRSLRFHPNSKARTLFRENPAKTTRRGTKGKLPVVASFVICLESGHTKKKTFTAHQIRRAVMRDFKAGGTIVLQLGWYQGTKESSVRVTLENTGTGLSDAEFKRKVQLMVEGFTDQFLQNEIWLDFYRGSRKVGSLKSTWFAG